MTTPKYEILMDPETRVLRRELLNEWSRRGYRLLHVYKNGDHLMELADVVHHVIGPMSKTPDLVNDFGCNPAGTTDNTEKMNNAFASVSRKPQPKK